MTYYGYDQAQRASTITDPDGDTTYITYDAHNNVTSTTTCAAVSNCQTSYASYYENLSNPLDPRNDKPTDSRDARSSSPTDPTYDTVTTYTPIGARSRPTTTPPTAGLPVRLHHVLQLYQGDRGRRRRRDRAGRPAGLDHRSRRRGDQLRLRLGRRRRCRPPTRSGW